MKTEKPISRRDFLKIAASLSITPRIGPAAGVGIAADNQSGRLPNIIILIFDALSALHLSLYDYPRQTSPNFERFASRATVYHNHHSAANFTTPSTASLFTSTYPWEHRAYTLRGLIAPEAGRYNIFRLLGKKYYNAAYTHNVNADMLLYQFEEYLDRHQASDSYNFLGKMFYNHFPSEEAISGLKSYDQFLIKREAPRGSLFASMLYDFSYLLRYRFTSRDLSAMYPIGMPSLPGSYVHFTLDEVVDGVISLLGELPSPFFSYIHLLPPHYPYRPDDRFYNTFNDGWSPPPKKRHPLGDGPRANYPNKRQTYDEFIANLDFEFGRLLEDLENRDLLDNSYLILTSDHGESFERGHRGHTTPMLFEPLLRVPLVISAPGQRERKDIKTFTSNLDLHPSLLQIAGEPIPEAINGRVLPGLEGASQVRDKNNGRIIWALEAQTNSTRGPLQEATLTMIRDQYKLIYYHGYRDYMDQYELYNLANDPDELVNRYPSDPAADEMQAVLDEKFKEISQSVSSV